MLNVETLDDTPASDTTPGFAGGLASFPPRAQLAANQFAAGINTMLTKAGVLQTRRGFNTYGPNGNPNLPVRGLGYFELPSGTKQLVVAWEQAGALLALGYTDGATFWTGIGSSLSHTTGESVQMAQGGDLLFLAVLGRELRTWNGTTLTTLGTGATDAPKAKFIVWGTNRLIAAGVATAPDTVYFSDILDASNGHWPANNRIRVGAGDGDPITGLIMWTKTLLVVFKRTRTFIVNCDPLATVAQFTIEEVPAKLGCTHHRTACNVGRDVWFLSDHGVRALSRVLNGEENEALTLSFPVADQIRLIADTSYNATAAVFFKGRYLLAHAQAGNLRILSFNTDHNCWEGAWDGVFPLCFERTRFGGVERLMLGEGTGQVSRWLHEDGAAENGTEFFDYGNVAIDTQVTTRGHGFGAELNRKQGFAVEIEFDVVPSGLGNTSVIVSVVPDEGAAVALGTVALAPGTGQRACFTLLHQPPFRAAAFHLFAGTRKLAVRAVRATAFMQTMEVGT
jgi:hypothetical protein